MSGGNAPTRVDNLNAILADPDARGVLYDLIDGTFRYCNENGALYPEYEAAIDVCRPALTQLLRLRACGG